MSKTYNPEDILVLPKVPEFDWLAELIKRLQSANDPSVEKMSLLYKYLIWSRRYALCTDKEHRTAYGFIVKYHRQLFNLELLPQEVMWIGESEGNLAASNAAIKLRAEGAEAKRF